MSDYMHKKHQIADVAIGKGQVIKLGQTVYDVVLCDDNIYRIYEMKIAAIEPFGSLYESKYFPDFLWNIYLTDDYSYAYRTFDDIGKKTFLTKDEAEAKLKELARND